MARKNLETEEQIDALDQVCMSLDLSDEKCELIREAAEKICPKSVRMVKGKRAPSEYNKFVGSCVKAKEGPITERFKACVVEWKAGKR